MSTCSKCGRYFSTTKQTDFCYECERTSLSNVSNCDIPTLHDFGQQKGWICPVCGRGVAPWTSFCPCQINRDVTFATGTGTSTYVNLDLKEYEKYATTNCEGLKL